MPELPEVETIRRQVTPFVLGRPIVASWARLGRITRPSVAAFVEGTRGTRILDSGRRGKQLYFPLASGHYLFIHLGMSGRLSIEPVTSSLAAAAAVRHVHAILRFDDGTQLVFTDPRTFGLLAVAPDLRLLDRLGPEPLDASFDVEAVARELGRHKTAIKAVLLDQRRVAGLGNIYADEVCFAAGVHPAARACDLSYEQLCRLVAEMRPLLECAIAARGATLKDGGYQDLFGVDGEFIPHAYGNTGQPCVVCGTPIAHGRLGRGKAARSYHFCPRCQGPEPTAPPTAVGGAPAVAPTAYPPRTGNFAHLPRVAEQRGSPMRTSSGDTPGTGRR